MLFLQQALCNNYKEYSDIYIYCFVVDITKA